MKIKAKKYQCLTDIAIQYTGTADTLYEIAQANGMSASDDIESEEIEIPDELTGNTRMKQHYETYHLNPATDLSAMDKQTNPYGGINYMGIEYNFIIS